MPMESELQKWQEEVLKMDIVMRGFIIQTDPKYVENPKPKKIKLSNPKKLEAMYQLEHGHQLTLAYISEQPDEYLYSYDVVTMGDTSGVLTISKNQKLDGLIEVQITDTVHIDYHFHKMELLRDFSEFMGVIVENIQLFVEKYENIK